MLAEEVEIGKRIRVTEKVNVNIGQSFTLHPGDVGTITCPMLDFGYFKAVFEGDPGNERPIYPEEAELIDEDYSDWPDDTEKQEVEPSYYDFPQGIEVRHISAHLTSFGGQALQYVARATRLDGRNKGNPIEDLTKALDFIQWEIDRLRELE